MVYTNVVDSFDSYKKETHFDTGFVTDSFRLEVACGRPAAKVDS